MVDKWLSTSEAAFELGVSGMTVLRMFERGELLGYKMSGRWKVRESDLDAYIQAAASMPQKDEWVRELELRAGGQQVPGVAELSAGASGGVPGDVLALLSEEERDTYSKLARGGDELLALKMVLAYAYLERD